MQAVRLTFFRVARGITPADPWLRPGVEEVSDFLVDHVKDLRKRASLGTAANATFVNAQDRALIEGIQSGDDEAFLAAAKTLGERLVAAMGPLGAAKPGLLLCATFHDDATPPITTAAVLKLEVVVPNGAVLQRLESGEETLAAVRDVLDKPGDLQKGLVFPDARPQSEAVVGDKAAHQEARYFLTATGVRLEAHSTGTARELVRAVAASAGPVVARKVARALPDVPPATPRHVLAGLRQVVPELTEDAAGEIADSLASAERPVAAVDTAAPVKATLRAGNLTVAGPADEVGSVTWSPDPEGGYTVTFHVDQEPKISWG